VGESTHQATPALTMGWDLLALSQGCLGGGRAILGFWIHWVLSPEGDKHPELCSPICFLQAHHGSPRRSQCKRLVVKGEVSCEGPEGGPGWDFRPWAGTCRVSSPLTRPPVFQGTVDSNSKGKYMHLQHDTGGPAKTSPLPNSALQATDSLPGPLCWRESLQL
jgi:hypothetical protein